MLARVLRGERDLAARLLPHKCHPPSHPARRPHAPATSATYQPLRHTIAQRMRMSPIDHPLMLMALLGHGSAEQQPARPRRRTWHAGSWGRT